MEQASQLVLVTGGTRGIGRTIVEFLISDASAGITGQAIVVDADTSA